MLRAVSTLYESAAYWLSRAPENMYILLFFIMVSGYLISTSQGDGIEFFGWFDVPSALELNADNTDLAGEVHFYLAWTLIVLAAIHAAAALKHHFIDRDDTLNNMILRKK